MEIEQFLREVAFKAIPSVPTDSAATPAELYDKCISLTCPDSQTVTDAIIGWHKLLTRYVNKEGAILLSRLYESTKDSTGDWDNRRNSLTICANYNYAFCSNHFPRLILIMALNGFVPDDDDFWNMMVTERKFHLSSLFGMAPIERRISAYDTKPYNAKCYALGWYLAHIVSVVDMPYRGCSTLDIKNIFALGEEKDWKYDATLGCMARRNNETLAANEKKMAIAHFLRLVDPINYFLVPNQTNVVYKKVNKSDKTPLGENDFVVQYMLCRAYERFGDTLLDFLDVALADFDIQEFYSQQSRIANSKISAKFAVNINPRANQQVYSHDEKIRTAAYYLRHKEGLVQVEENHLGLAGKGGWVAKAILNELGIDTARNSPHKGLLMAVANIDDAITAANGTFKATLEEIKQQGI